MEIQKLKVRALSLALSVAMVSTMLPITALAADSSVLAGTILAETVCADTDASGVILVKLLELLKDQQTMIDEGGADVTATDEFKTLAAEIDALYAHVDACETCAAQMAVGGTFHEKFYGTQALTASTPTVGTWAGSSVIFANGTELVIEGTSDTSTTIYIDANGNGAKDEGEKSLKDARITNAPEDGADLSTWFVFGGTDATAYTGDTHITINGGSLNGIMGGCNTASMTGNTNVTMNGGKIKWQIQGGNQSGTITGNVLIEINGGTSRIVQMNSAASRGELLGNTTVKISGGSIFDDNSVGIIVGGTISGTKKAEITGGSVANIDTSKGITVVGTGDIELLRYRFTVPSASSGTEIKSISLTEDYTYIAKDIILDSNKRFYLWLPKSGKNFTLINATTDSDTYSGTIVNKAATLEKVSVTGITVTPNSSSVQKGGTKQYTATVSGTNAPQTVTWAVSGNAQLGTTINTTGLLTVDVNETDNTSLTITATSTFDTSKSGSTTALVADKTPVTITGLSAPANRKYNAAAIVSTEFGTPSYSPAWTGSLEYTYYEGTGTGGTKLNSAPKDAGTYTAVASIPDSDPTYMGNQQINFTIAKADVTITAPTKTAYVGETPPALSASDCTITGLASGETLKTAPTVAYVSTPDMTKVGEVAINASLAAVPDGGNYHDAITYVAGKLTISTRSSGGGGGSSSTGNTGSSVTVDGKTESIGKVENSGSTTTVVVDATKLDSKVTAAKDGSSVVVPVSTTKDSAAAQLVMESVEKMAAKSMTLEVKSGKTTYALPAAAIDTGSVLSQLGATDAAKVPFTVTITNEKNVKVEGATVVGTPMSFTVTATYNGKSVTVDSFDSMVARTMEITKEQAGKVTTAVVVDADGTVRHVPTSVYEQGGKWYAKINSMTNSSYALITNESKFTDVSGKWYEAAASELSAREVTDGVFGTAFEGEKNITRAEFAGLLVNAFGLPKNGKADFSDVAADAWYSEAVATASEYGIANGIGGGKFAPDATITRQEAMVMIQRAASVVSYTGGGTDNGTFTDRAEVGAWAAEGVAFNLANGLIVGNNGKINPNGTITRAETATVLLRLLQKAELVDVRAEV